MHGWFEATAAAYPDSPAITSPSKSYTYRELNERANQVARVLLSNGLQKGGIRQYLYGSRSGDDHLPAWYSEGRWCVCSDRPEHPQERSSYIVKIRHPPRAADGGFLCPDFQLVLQYSYGPSNFSAVDGRLAGFAASNPNLDIQPDDLAYIILHIRVDR